MIRTQIYLTKYQRDHLAAIAKTTGKKQSELIREAVDRLIDQASRGRREAVLRGGRREAVLREAAGIWKDRSDLPDFKATRAEWDRN
jgi:plasmid stabilization system protein ParE